MAILFARQRDTDDAPMLVEMNTTPLIDVMLVLLVMLIITIPIQQHAVSLDMPVGAPPRTLREPVVVQLSVSAANQVLWNGELLPDRAALDARLQEAAAASEQPELHIQPDRGARYEVVAAVLAASQRAGMKKLGIVGSEQFAP